MSQFILQLIAMRQTIENQNPEILATLTKFSPDTEEALANTLQQDHKDIRTLRQQEHSDKKISYLRFRHLSIRLWLVSHDNP
jgi:hypothetical protein